MGAVVVKRVLMIAYHYPPMHGSSGIQRTLKFSRYLPEFGWEPVVLSAHPRAFERTSADQLGEIPASVPVTRGFAVDTARHLAIGGRYPLWLALPDRWISWWLGAVPAGLKLVRRYRPDVIWSTYPIPTAHLIGLTLARLTRIPWVADFRDPMTDVDYPPDPLKRRVYGWIERKSVESCARAVFTTPGTVEMFRARFPEVPAERFAMIENGYDEENFRAAQRSTPAERRNGPLRLVHSGTLYPSERDPRPFFGALADLSKAGTLSPSDLRIVLRATGHDDYLRTLVDEFGIGALVELAPPISYGAALAEMLDADGLLVLQAANCNQQIPAKLYEYLRARRPILALTDPAGDTAAALRNAGIDTIARLDDSADIARALPVFVERLRAGTAPVAADDRIVACSRRSRSRELATLFDGLTGREA